MKFNQETFLKGYKVKFGPLTQDLSGAIEALIGFIDADDSIGSSTSDRQRLAYCLATFKWETAHTLQPIDEHGSEQYFNDRYGPQTAVGKRLGNTEAGDGARFHGRGYVQLTGRSNYLRASKELGVDLLANPTSAKEPQVAYRIAIRGMQEGWFTNKKLADFIKPGNVPDYENARRIINGLDKAQTIAGIASHMDDILQASLTA
jgi:putative chitinase